MHDPNRIPMQLGGKLASRSRHICLLLGAGASRAAGLPDLAGLQNRVCELLDDEHARRAAELFEQRNLEETLSYLRRLASILEGDEELRGFTSKRAHELQDAITHAIIPALDTDEADVGPFRLLASWVAGGFYAFPVEIFTINYDLLIERGLEESGVPYFDGFVGNLNARFQPELVDTAASGEDRTLPAAFVRLWKLHGSVNWSEQSTGETKRIVRLGTPVGSGSPAAIYPSDEKYDQSRRVPFVVLMDRFRKALAIQETVTLVCGYSFGDQHLNEMLFDAARDHPRSEVLVFCYSDIPGGLAERALQTRNLTVFGREEAVIGGVRDRWGESDEIPGIWEKANFQMGDFACLASFVARQPKEQHDEA